jgi:hypothetical protein
METLSKRIKIALPESDRVDSKAIALSETKRDTSQR